MNRVFVLIGIFLIAIGALAGGIFGHLPSKQSPSTTVTTDSISDDYSEAVSVIDDNYATEVDHEGILDASVQRMLWSLDPHSSFFTQAQLTKFFEEQQSEFYGIGVSILQHRGGVYVQSVIKGTPADEGGLRYGDRFVGVDGKSAENWTSAEVSKNVRGKRGTSVKVKVERAGESEPIEFEIVRGGVPLPSIRNYFKLNQNTGYIGLSGGFQETTSKELSLAIQELDKEGMDQLVLDLRGNRGGLLPQAIEVVSQFIPRGQVVVSVRGRSTMLDSRDLRTVGGTVHDFPIVVLINGTSASASEIVAGAVQDYGRGLVVGSESFGKGLVQQIYKLPLGTGLTLTTGRYYTPYGRSLQRDYSSGGIYEYFMHTNAVENANTATPEDGEPAPIPTNKPKGEPVKTAGGREFFGGQGIVPDIEADPLAYTDLRFRISEDAFFFVRELVAGQIKGFENYKVDGQNFKITIADNELIVNDSLYAAFLKFVEEEQEDGISSGNVGSQAEFARTRIREELATANYSSEAGFEVSLKSDPQVLSAVEALPQSAELFASIYKKQ